MDTTQSTTQPPRLPESFGIAGFWRRLCALFIDLLMLGVVGWIIGEIFFEPLARIGDWAKIIGFVMALAYFGVCNSRVFGGQTLAKRWLGLQVVDANGSTVSPARSILRYAVLGVPFFAGGLAVTSASMMDTVLAYALSLFGVGSEFAIVYLYIFNRRTRQSLHDLAVGSYVVRAEPASQGVAFPHMWRGHLVVAALLALLALTGPYVGDRLAQNKMFAGILPLYQTLSAQPYVIGVQVVRGSIYRNGDTTHSIQATLRLDAPLTGDNAMAKHVAQLLAKGDPDVANEDYVDVTLSHGFTLGVASGSRKQMYSFKPDELK